MLFRRMAVAATLVVAACAAQPPSITAVSPPRAPSWDEPGGDAMRAVPRSLETPSLLGLGDREIEEMLGRPRFVRRDGPAQIWQYGTAACTMNLFLYREGPLFKVRHVEIRGRSADLASPSGCERSLVSMRAP